MQTNHLDHHHPHLELYVDRHHRFHQKTLTANANTPDNADPNVFRNQLKVCVGTIL